jgi:hypothetical protein
MFLFKHYIEVDGQEVELEIQAVNTEDGFTDFELIALDHLGLKKDCEIWMENNENTLKEIAEFKWMDFMREMLD